MTTTEETLDSWQPPWETILPPIAALVFVIAVVASGAGNQTVWYVIRGTGIIGFVLLTLSVVVGLLISTRSLPSGRPRVDLFEIHAFTSLLGLGFVSVHAFTLLLDNFVSFSPAQVLVPFTSTYRPFAVSLGIVGMYTMVVVYGSFWARRYIGHKRWRTLHYASFVGFFVVALHGMLSGADSHTAWMFVVYTACIGAVLALTAKRLLARPSLRTQGA
jgi:methionine sulfoxide reductase heme-binding subunit